MSSFLIFLSNIFVLISASAELLQGRIALPEVAPAFPTFDAPAKRANYDYTITSYYYDDSYGDYSTTYYRTTSHYYTTTTPYYSYDYTCPASATSCADQQGCCPTGAPCTSTVSNGRTYPQCDIPCLSAAPRCGAGCCEIGYTCLNDRCTSTGFFASSHYSTTTHYYTSDDYSVNTYYTTSSDYTTSTYHSTSNTHSPTPTYSSATTSISTIQPAVTAAPTPTPTPHAASSPSQLVSTPQSTNEGALRSTGSHDWSLTFAHFGTTMVVVMGGLLAVTIC